MTKCDWVECKNVSNTWLIQDDLILKGRTRKVRIREERIQYNNKNVTESCKIYQKMYRFFSHG